MREASTATPAATRNGLERLLQLDDPVVHEPADELEREYERLIFERWRETGPNRQLTTGQLDAFYRLKPLIPRRMQLASRRVLIRWQRRPAFPQWPLDLTVGRILRDYAFRALRTQGRKEAAFRWFWPAGYDAALILTHDVEGEGGLRLALELADAEEALGFRSSFNVGAWYDVDPGFVRELTSRGFEVGVHGLRHDRSLFASREAFEAQQPRLRELVERVGASGFRSPATHRILPWIAELPIEYDSSVPHSDPYEPQPGGCCSLWPFFIGPVVELPYTLPQDHLLFTLLRHKTPALWIEQAQRIEGQFGLVQAVSHPDPGYLGEPENRARYIEFLQALAERPRLWRALPSAVAAWWRERDAARAPLNAAVRVGEGSQEVELVPPAADEPR